MLHPLRKTSNILLLAVVVLIVLFVVRLRLSPLADDNTPRAATPTTETQSPRPASVATIISELEPATNDRGRSVRKPNPALEAQPRSLVADTTDPFIAETRRRALENPEAAMLWVHNEEKAADRLRGMLEVVAVWAADDAPNALVWLETYAQGNGRLEAVNHGIELWSQQDPVAAARWIGGMANDGSKLAAVQALVSNWAETDPQAAIQWITTLPANAIRDEAARNLVNTWMPHDPEAATIWALAEAEFDGNHKLLNDSIRQFTAIDPAAAESFIRKLTEARQTPDVIEAYVESLAQEQPGIAADWLASLHTNDPLYSPDHARILMQEWSRSDSVAASTWLSERTPGPERDAAITGFASTMIPFEPEAVAEWANIISDPQQRMQTLTRSLTAWAQAHPRAALEWVQGADLSAAVRQDLTQKIIASH